ncbi:hypothetical protein BCR44DRAFT_389806 [Catenaria anguillulae PL171]|uniref:Choice-of-anchor A domain-containing protein n=1 Tax=Catenaria anguillulae PL171 TaxID=765915 RepID=A0A1Y2I277_9FUNG|nr:hypothetical protein BCR44DRAFT_389806 [Catenaria anguillulae PL171]
MLYGTVLAPSADITGNGFIYGQVFAKTGTHSCGQLPFSGVVPGTDAQPGTGGQTGGGGGGSSSGGGSSTGGGGGNSGGGGNNNGGGGSTPGNNGGCGTTSSGGPGFSCGDNAVTCIPAPFHERVQEFNAIYYGNLNKPDGGRVEGRLAVRGDVVINDFSVGDNLPNPNAPCQCGCDNNAALIVGGTLNFQRGRVHGGILIDSCKGAAGISASVLASLNPNCYARAVDDILSRIPFDRHQQNMRLLSAHLLTLTPTLSIRWDDNLSGWRVYRVRDSVTTRQEVLTFPQGVPSVNIINWQEVVTSLLGSRTLIVNLPGVAISGMDYEPLASVADRVIWNFGPDATAVTITQVRLYGTVIAPKATITGTGSIFGQVFAMTAGHSIHLAQFRGCVSAVGSGAAGGSTGAPVITQEQLPAPRPRPPTAPQVPAPPGTCARVRRFGSFEWNVLVFGDVEQTRSLNVDGRLAVGGSFKAAGMSIGDELQAQNVQATCQSTSLLIGGSPDSITGRVWKGAIGVQSQFVGHISNQPATARCNSDICPPIGLSADQLRAQLDFAAARAYFVALSRALYSLPATMRLQYPGQGSVTPTLVPITPRPGGCPSEFEVIQLTPSDINIVGFNNWEQVHGLFIAGKTLIINVPVGAVLDVGDWSPLPTSRVIWNFGPDATQVRIRVPLRGLVLAPAADLQGTTEVEGQVVVASISKAALGFSFALRPAFDGCVPNVA